MMDEMEVLAREMPDLFDTKKMTQPIPKVEVSE